MAIQEGLGTWPPLYVLGGGARHDRPDLERIARSPFEGQAERTWLFISGMQSADTAVGEREIG